MTDRPTRPPRLCANVFAAAGPIATRLIEHSPNRGKGAAVRAGLLAATQPDRAVFGRGFVDAHRRSAETHRTDRGR